MSRKGTRVSCVRNALGDSPSSDPRLPAPPEGGRHCWGLCQVREMGQQLAPSQPQMLAWSAVPGAASPEDPLAGAGGGCLGCLLSTPTVQGALCPARYQPHVTETLGR